jgi:hypothetical protein
MAVSLDITVPYNTLSGLKPELRARAGHDITAGGVHCCFHQRLGQLLSYSSTTAPNSPTATHNNQAPLQAGLTQVLLLRAAGCCAAAVPFA